MHFVYSTGIATNFHIFTYNMNIVLAQIPDDVFGHVLTVYRQQESNLGPGVADIQVAHYHTSHHNMHLVSSIVSIVVYFIFFLKDE